MFYRGFKQTVLNEDMEPPISSDATRLTIPGFCDIDVEAGIDIAGIKDDPVAAAAGTWTAKVIPADILCAQSSITIKFYFEPFAGGGVDSGSARKEFTFVSDPIVGTGTIGAILVGDVDTAINTGLARHLADFPEEELMITSVTSASGTLTIVGNIAFANMQLIGVHYSSDGATYQAKATAAPYPEPGTGYGWMIEAEQQLSTYQTRSPYAIDVAGAQPVDVKGTYVVFIIETKSDGVDWVRHEPFGYGDANTTGIFNSRGYTISVNSENTALIDKINLFVTGLPSLPKDFA